MKNTKPLFLVLLLVIIHTMSIAQNCKFKKNEYDPALKLHIKTTEREMLTNEKSSSADDNLLGAVIHKENDSIWLLLGVTVLRDFKEDYSTVTNGMKAYVYFNNNETAELIVATNAKSKLWDKKHLGKFQYMLNVYYYFPKSVFQKFQGQPISKIKIEIINSAGQKNLVETIIKEKYQLKISELIKCMQ